MKKNLWAKIAFIFILTLLSGFVVYGTPVFGKKFDFSLGLDLSGGSRLVFEAQTGQLTSDDKQKALESLKTVIEKRVNLFGVSESNVMVSSFEGKDRIVVELPGITDPSEATSLIGQTAQLLFSEVASDASDSATLLPTSLTGADLKSADVVFDQNTGNPAVSIEFNEQGSAKFEELTAKNIGKPLAIVLDGSLISAPVVNEKIVGGSAQISGGFSLDDAKQLSVQLNAGALPLSVKLVEEKTVGASLGGQSIEKSLKAGIVGVIMVSVFMLLIYGKYGLVADLSLLIFGLITLAIYKMVPITLTVPGIAGFFLSVGMAVDSNILIFERLKEEIKNRSPRSAMEISFGKAWDSIRDANIATLFTAFVLANPLDWQFLHISGPVRGFAMTLALGIGISLFTGLFVSRNLLRLMVKD